MDTCLKLAAQAAGRTSPNPLVGAVVIGEDGLTVAEGYHQAAGQPHAEVVALEKAGEKARGGTLYVNLEPCSHWGKTPPCVDRVIASGVKSVVVGMVDPNPEVSGAGIKALREAGIEVTVGVLEQDCRWLNRGFIKTKILRIPWLCLKLATTLDGKIADRQGTSRWVSGLEARLHVHELRNTFDCVLIGAATVVIDDPELNVRGIPGGRHPLRVVVDPELVVSPSARICRPDSGGATVIFCSQRALDKRGKSYPEHVRLVAVGTLPRQPQKLDLRSVLSWLSSQGMLTVLCEGGGRLSAALLKTGLADEVEWIVSPKIIGDPQAIAAVAGEEPVLLSDAIQLHRVSVKLLGSDVLIQGTLPFGPASSAQAGTLD